jgi:hypothetical protein
MEDHTMQTMQDLDNADEPPLAARWRQVGNMSMPGVSYDGRVEDYEE